MRRSIGLSIVLLLSLCTSATGTTTPAPDFSWTTEGKTVHISDLTGHVVIVNFYASWCPPCQDEMPALIAASQRYADQGVVFVGVDTGGDTVKQAVAFAKRYGIAYQIVVDTSSTISDAYHVTQYPTTLLVDQSGAIVSRMEDEMSGPQIDRMLGRYVAHS